jgi:hypothetical protein
MRETPRVKIAAMKENRCLVCSGARRRGSYVVDRFANDGLSGAKGD